MTAVAAQNRFDEVDPGSFEIGVTNTGTTPFTVTSVRLDSPGFAATDATAREEPFPPSVRYDMPARYGAARCDRAVEPATAVVEVRPAQGPAQTVRVPLASPDGLLARLHDQDCARQDLAQKVQVTLADVRQDGVDVRAAVHVQRLSAGGTITVTELRDSKLFAFTVMLPADLAATSAVLDIPAVIRAAGCYGHLLADVKQPYLFPLFLRFDGGPPQYTEVASTHEQQEQLQAMLRAACAGRTS